MIRGFGMRSGRSLAVLLACCLAGLAVSPVAALGESTSSSEGSGASSLGGPLVVSGSPTEVQQAQAAEEARLSSPEVVAAEEASRTKFEGLDSEQAAKLVGEVFPQAIDHPMGGPPQLPAGQRITAFPSGNVASVDLGGSEHGAIESLEPMAVEDSSGQRVPIDLSLSEKGDAFHSVTPLVDVQIPKRLGEGVQLPSVGVSMTPVDAQGSALAGTEGVMDGAVAFYASTQTDADTVIKPVTLGKMHVVQRHKRPVNPRPIARTDQHSLPPGLHLRRSGQAHRSRTPPPGSCTTRSYGYEEDTNRTSLTTYQPNSKNECSTETTSTVEKHTYDTTDRLTDTGTKYSEFGNITSLPAADAGGKEASENLTSTYYVNNQLASQTQSGETIGYNLDPTGRTREQCPLAKQQLTSSTTMPAVATAQRGQWKHHRATGPGTSRVSAVGGLRRSKSTGRYPCCNSATCTAISSPQQPLAKPKRNVYLRGPGQQIRPKRRRRYASMATRSRYQRSPRTDRSSDSP